MKKADFTKEHNAGSLFIKHVHLAPDPKIMDRRKELAEHPFGTIKRAMDAGYVLTRGTQNVTGEFSLAFLAYNLKRVINILGSKALVEAIKSGHTAPAFA